MGQPAWSIRYPVRGAVHPGRPELHIAFRGLNELRVLGDAGQQELCPVMLVIPGLGPLVTPVTGLVGAPQITGGNRLVQIGLLTCRQV